MKIKFFGGAQEVGRSSILLKDELSIMMDFGMKVEGTEQLPIEIPENVDAFILSHAHLDHSGAAPALYRYAHMPAFGTKPSLELSMMLLNDALNISKKNHTNIKYNKKQIETFKNRYNQLDYGDIYNFGNYDISMFNAGHICGSAITLLERAKAKDNKRIVYTGDFKIGPQILNSNAKIVKSDLLIIESTYASVEHPDREELTKKFINEVETVIDDGGTALIPAFAVGRSQELLTMLYMNNLGSYVYMDGMSREATRIVTRNEKFINNAESLHKAINEATLIDKLKDRNSAVEGPSIILTTAGMLNGGPVLNYITKLNSNSKIFITGYQVEGTNGRSLVDSGYIKLDKRKFKIQTPVSVYDFSAHAGNSDLFKYVRESSPNTVICVHGDKERTKLFAEELRGEGFDAYAPKVGETINLQ